MSAASKVVDDLEITRMHAGGKAASKLVKHASRTSAASKEDVEIRALQRLLRQYLCGCTSTNTAVDDLEITRLRAAGTAASNLVKHASSTSAASSKDDLEITRMRAFGNIPML